MGCQLDGERFVITQVPMQDVEFRQGHGFDQPFDGVDFQEMPGTIDHDASMRHKGLVLNRSHLDPVALDHLRQGLQRIHIPTVGLHRDLDMGRFPPDLQMIPLIILHLLPINNHPNIHHPTIILLDNGLINSTVQIIVLSLEDLVEVITAVDAMGGEYGSCGLLFFRKDEAHIAYVGKRKVLLWDQGFVLWGGEDAGDGSD